MQDRQAEEGGSDMNCAKGAVAGALLAVLTMTQGGAACADEAKPVKVTYIIYTEAGSVFWNPGLQGIKDAAKLF